MPRKIAAGEALRAKVILIVVAIAVAAGAATAVSPKLAIVALMLGAVAFLLGLGARLPHLFIRVLIVLLGGYAVLGRGFAHFGQSPIYVGEVVLALGLLSLIITIPRARWRFQHVVLIAFMLWGLIRTVPYWSVYRFDALRDAVLWGYGLFAIAASFAIDRSYFEKIVGWYRRFVPAYLLWVPIATIIDFAFKSHIPMAPDHKELMLVVDGGEMGVHLAGAAAFLLIGIEGGAVSAFWSSLVWPMWFLGFTISGALSRGGLVADALGAGAAFLIRPTKRVVPALLISVGLLLLLTLVNPTISPGGHRSFSVRQFTTNIMSIAGNQNMGDLQATKEWRLQWWTKIVDYTINGPYFWTGKGFGINLADADGFQVTPDHSLRAPHNGHMDVLARMGVPGLTLWVILQLSWAAGMLRGFFRARRRGQVFWSQLDAWLFAYWLAIVVNASFDVYLEGPQGGILMWSVMGLGLGALRLQDAPEEIPAPADRQIPDTVTTGHASARERVAA